MVARDQRIADFLQEGFERDLYVACINNASDTSNALRLNNFAFAMRELVRNVLNRIAPDDEVSRCEWFVQEHQSNGKATGSQKARYSVQGGLSNAYVSDVLKVDLRPVIERHQSAVRALSEFTHVRPQVFNLDASEIEDHIAETNDAVGELFEAITNVRDSLIYALWSHIDGAVVNEALSESIQAFDEAATHYWIDEIGTEVIEIIKIDHEAIHFDASGWITAELQWGSNSDVRRGDGAQGSLTRNFQCQLTSPVDEPESISVIEGSLGVDEAPWQGREDEMD